MYFFSFIFYFFYHNVFPPSLLGVLLQILNSKSDVLNAFSDIIFTGEYG